MDWTDFLQCITRGIATDSIEFNRIEENRETRFSIALTEKHAPATQQYTCVRRNFYGYEAVRLVQFRSVRSSAQLWIIQRQVSKYRTETSISLSAMNGAEAPVTDKKSVHSTAHSTVQCSAECLSKWKLKHLRLRASATRGLMARHERRRP